MRPVAFHMRPSTRVSKPTEKHGMTAREYRKAWGKKESDGGFLNIRNPQLCGRDAATPININKTTLVS